MQFQVLSIAPLAAAIALTAVLMSASVPALGAWLISVNLATLAVYAWDKGAAASQARRVPEMTLHALALLGGSPAALLGQRLFQHKTRKRSFQIAFRAIVATQILLMGLWLWRSTRT